LEHKNNHRRILDRWPVGNIGLASVGQTVHIEIFVIFAIGSGMLTGKVLLKPARKPKPCPLPTSLKNKRTTKLLTKPENAKIQKRVAKTYILVK